MAQPLAVYVELKKGLLAQVIAKIFHLVFKLFQKPTANTDLIHFSRVVLVPESPTRTGFFSKTRAAMLITTYDNGMMPYFMAFYQSKAIMRHFRMMSLFAKKKLPKPTGNLYLDYNNFETWLAAVNIMSPSFYNAYPVTLEQVYMKFPDQNPTPGAKAV